MSLKQRLIGANILITSVVMGMLSWFIPKQKGLILFYPAFEPNRYDGNLKPVFEHLSPRLPVGWRAEWISRRQSVVDEIRGKGFHASKHFGRALFTLIRAEIIVLDKNEPRLGIGRFRMIQTWHGTGFKRIALETPGLSASRLRAFRWHFRHYEVIVANCPEDQARKVRCFGNDRVEILGTPRGDMLLRGDGSGLALKTKLGLSPDQRIISYCPTFRDSGVARPFTAQGWQTLNDAMANENSLLLVKPHRFDKAIKVPRGLSHIRNVTPDIDDVMDLLAISDVLISDYSSISTDYALTGRPLIFYTYDAAAYQERGARLVYDLFDTLPGPFVDNEAALIAHLTDLSWFDAADHQTRYDAFRRRFHTYLDDQSTRRVTDAILARIGAPTPDNSDGPALGAGDRT